MIFLTCIHQTTKAQLILSVVILVSIFMATLLVNNHFLSIDRPEAHTGLLTKQLSLLCTPSKFFLLPFIVRAAARLQYLMLSTYGLFFLGSFLIFEILTQQWRENRLSTFSHPKFNIVFLILLSSVGIFASSTLISGPRGDHLFYGRYSEGFVALYLALGLLFIWSKQSYTKIHILNPSVTSAIILILTILIVAAYGFQKLTKVCYIANVNLFNVLGIFPFIAIFRRLDIIFIPLIVIPMIFLLSYAFKYNFQAGLALLVLYFCGVSMSGYTVFYLRASYIGQITTLASHIQSLKTAEAVSYDRAFENADTWPAYQYLLPSIVFKTFSSAKDELPASRVVISGKGWKCGRTLQGKLVARENDNPEMPFIIRRIAAMFSDKPLSYAFAHHIDQSLWLLPEKTKFPLPLAVEPSP